MGSVQPPAPPTTPEDRQVLVNTRRTLLQLVANIDAALRAGKEKPSKGR